MATTPVLVANEPRSYRDAIAQAVQAARPTLHVLAIAPTMLAPAIHDHHPQMVVCSAVPPDLEPLAPLWIELYPLWQSVVTIRVRKELTRLPDLTLDDLLHLMDTAMDLPQ